MLECRPVQSVPELRYLYPLLERACQRIADREGVAFFAPGVYAEIVAGRAWMFAVWDGAEEVGCFVCYRQDDPRAGTPKLVVWLAYAEPGAPQGALEAGMARCEAHAADLGCRQVRFHARRSGWLKAAEAIGYRQVEYVFEKRI